MTEAKNLKRFWSSMEAFFFVCVGMINLPFLSRPRIYALATSWECTLVGLHVVKVQYLWPPFFLIWWHHIEGSLKKELQQMTRKCYFKKSTRKYKGEGV